MEKINSAPNYLKKWDQLSILRLEKSADAELKVANTMMITVLTIIIFLPMTLIIKSIFDGNGQSSIIEMLKSIGIVKASVFIILEAAALRLAGYFQDDALEKFDYIVNRKFTESKKHIPLKQRISHKS